MPTLITILGLGFLLGIRHATDADHVVAISAISARQKNLKGSTLIGALWGIGHSAMVTIVGIAIIFFSLNISEQTGKILESIVGLMLIVLGLMNVFNIRIEFFRTVKPLIVGLVHGLAGSAAIALLILATIKNPQDAAFYLLVFNIGVIVGMMIITTLLGTSFAYARKKVNNLHKYLVLGSGIISIIFGTYIIFLNKT